MKKELIWVATADRGAAKDNSETIWSAGHYCERKVSDFSEHREAEGCLDGNLIGYREVMECFFAYSSPFPLTWVASLRD